MSPARPGRSTAVELATGIDAAAVIAIAAATGFAVPEGTASAGRRRATVRAAGSPGR